MRYLTCSLAAFVAVAAASTLHAQELSDLVAPGAEVEKVVGDCKFTEGPAYSPKGFLLFSDIPNSRIVRVDADGTVSGMGTVQGPAFVRGDLNAGTINGNGTIVTGTIGPNADVNGTSSTGFVPSLDPCPCDPAERLNIVGIVEGGRTSNDNDNPAFTVLADPTIYADGNGATARFRFPGGITTDGSRLYIVDEGGNVVRAMQ